MTDADGTVLSEANGLMIRCSRTSPERHYADSLPRPRAD